MDHEYGIDWSLWATEIAEMQQRINNRIIEEYARAFESPPNITKPSYKINYENIEGSMKAGRQYPLDLSSTYNQKPKCPVCQSPHVIMVDASSPQIKRFYCGFQGWFEPDMVSVHYECGASKIKGVSADQIIIDDIVEDNKCTCNMIDLMRYGCQCGGV